jgi:hypothetical protein
MDENIGDIVTIVDLGGRSEVALLIPKELSNAANGSHEHIDPNIKLPPIIKKDIFDILLDNKTMFGTMFLNMGPNLLKTNLNENPIPTIGVFPRLNYPQRVLLLRTYFCEFTELATIDVLDVEC